MATVRLRGSGSSGFEAIPEGEYEATVMSLERTESKSSEYHYWKTQFSLTEPPYVNRRVWSNYSENPKADWMLFNFLEATDTPIEKFEDGEWEAEIDPDFIIGKNVIVKLKPGEYNGKPQNDVVGIKPLEDGETQLR